MQLMQIFQEADKRRKVGCRRLVCYPILYKYKKQLQKIERKVGMEYQKAYKQG